MAWNKFAHLSKSLDLLEAPGIKGSNIPTRRQELPVAEAKRANMLTVLELLADYRNDAGTATEKPATVSRFMQVELSRQRKARGQTEDWLPDWAREIVNRQGSPEELMRVTFDKMVREPSQKTFQEAEIVINELGRSPEGSALFKRYLTPEYLQKLTRMMHA